MKKYEVAKRDYDGAYMLWVKELKTNRDMPYELIGVFYSAEEANRKKMIMEKLS